MSIELSALSALGLEEQDHLGCSATLREILQQPQTWRQTASLIGCQPMSSLLTHALAMRPEHIVLTGSGSSVHAAECLAAELQAALRIPCRAIPAGDLLTHPRGLLPGGNGLLVSFARSGDSPESAAAVDLVLAEAPTYTHLIVTCNAQGRLATRYRNQARVQVLLLDAQTNDRSLVMTSSFTNMLLAGSGLAYGGNHDVYSRVADAAAMAQGLFDRYADAIAIQARQSFDVALYLGSGTGLGAARESALKMLEMSAGAVTAMAETYLGLRHGPMSALSRPTLIVAFLSAQPDVRHYEYDLLRELERKQLGFARIVVGEAIPPELIGPSDLAIDLPGMFAIGDTPRHMLTVVVGQLLAFFRCLHLGQKPDAPSPGVLTRVVADFAIHNAGERK